MQQIIFLIFIFTMLSPATAYTIPFVNPSFEDPVLPDGDMISTSEGLFGWDTGIFSTGETFPVVLNSLVPAIDGENILILTPGSFVTQTISGNWFVPGERYVLDLWADLKNIDPNTVEQLITLVEQQDGLLRERGFIDINGWNVITMAFTVPENFDTSTDLKFTIYSDTGFGSGSDDFWLDAISLRSENPNLTSPVPVPGAIWLFISAVLPFLTVASKRRK